MSNGVVIVGSGLAGLSAASQLVEKKIPVHMLERLPKPGGNSIKASSGINGAPTRFQPLPDDLFYADTIKSAGAVISQSREKRESLISTLTNSSKDAVDWLVDVKGIDLSKVAQLGGHSKPRTHRGAGQTPPGAAIVTTLLKSLKESPLFELQTNCAVTKVLTSEDGVTGVEYTCAEPEKDNETKQLLGPVIFASGGFAGDATGMLAQYRPDLAGFPSTNDPRPGTQPLLTAVGAQLLDMEMVQVHPTGFVDPKATDSKLKFLAAEALRGEGGLLLMNGKRFFNELDTREKVTNTIMSHTPTDEGNAHPKQWDATILLDEGAFKALESHVGFYVWKGLMKKTTASELGESVLPIIQDYADVAAGKKDDAFGRKHFGHWSLADVKPDSPIWMGRVTPVVHFTMGGVIISKDGEVLDTDGKPIKGLWAAGEITGGVHGENRLGGSSLLECVVFGRRAGDAAAAATLN